MKNKTEEAKGKRRKVMGKGAFKELRVWQKRKDLAVYIPKETFKEIEKGCIENLLPLAVCLSPFP